MDTRGSLSVLIGACGGAEPTPGTDLDDDDTPHADGIDLDLFFDGALADEVTMQDCTLPDGTDTTCYAMTIAGYPATYKVGPFCPETTAASADEGGIWFDGNGVYDLDAIHSPLGEAAEAAAGLDECQGHTTEADGYHYHAAGVAENAILSCFAGVTVESTGRGGGRGPRGGGRPPAGGPAGRGGPPDFGLAAEALGITEQELMDALGGPPLDVAAAAATLGVTVDELQRVLDPERAGSR